jgi:hypothetical protein
MIRPGWLAVALTVLVLAIAVTCATRFAATVRSRQGELDADAAHVLTGVAMAGMFLSGLTTLPGRAWEAVFAAGAAWFAWRTVRVRRPRTAPAPAGTAVPASQAGRADGGPASDWAAGDWAAGNRAAGNWAAGGCGTAGGDSTGQYRGAGYLCAHPLPHLIDCLAMVYALWAVPAVIAGTRAGGAMGSMGMAGGARLPLLGLVLAACVCGYVVWLGDRLQLGPRIATCCTIGMGVAMGVMLIDLL